LSAALAISSHLTKFKTQHLLERSIFLAALHIQLTHTLLGLKNNLDCVIHQILLKAAGVKQGNGEDFEKYPCFTLGCFDVTTLDMAVGMATFAAHGIRCNAIAITEVKDRYGKNLNVPSADCERTIDLQVADSTTAVLAGVIDGPVKGRTGQAMDLGSPAAGKTGTTDSSAAVWFVGYTPDMAAAVWVGDPRGGQKYPMKNVTINGRTTQVFGSTMPGPIWRDSLIGALEGTPKTALGLKHT
jgi:membrane peptidoglycan carboxypeptidase